ncbi:tetratricopeptide repeat protein [Alcanivorax sp. JB21]|uniref:tetratricopeptide repeat protein n=1 Tax=Alcanivorax limicola TaxID=2874102 RepID=UPI001CC06B5E|nr:tetratricopeptide repeat protein [Alcanivorax limicola]MBZ2187518.1 tetratricopeptide repeat protein [Alcanivorax limicola]
MSVPGFRRQTLAAMVMLLTAGCASQQTAEPVRYGGTTLADLEQMDIAVAPEALERATPQQALESYRRAVELFQDPAQRVAPLQRMADLAVSAAEDQQFRTEDLREQPQVDTLAGADRSVDADIDAMLYDNFMRSAQDTHDPEEKFALLGLASNVAADLEGGKLNANLSTAIMLYHSLLETSQDPDQLAHTWYSLAKVHELAGDLDSSLVALENLVERYPDSEYVVEAEFRRGELLFMNSEYDTAASAYATVIAAQPRSEFYEQARYKRGWSEYLMGDFQRALADFFRLIDHLHAHPAMASDTSMQAKLMQDTRRAVSLTFINLDGAESVRNWFARTGHRNYEADIYESLGEVYLQQERYRDAADTFDTFVRVYPADHRAPAFSTREIQAYQRGGFPSLVLPAKEQFVERYGVSSEFWLAQPDIRAQYLDQLKGHILDLARHYHAVAQSGTNATDYALAARWYREYLDTPPPGEAQADINHRYAEVLFASEAFEQAITEFERTAYSYPEYADAGDAGYFALVAYQAEQERLKAASDASTEAQAAQDDLRQRKIRSGLLFASTFATHERVPQVLYSLTEDQLASGDTRGAVRTAGILVNRQPQPDDAMLRYGWATIANGEFDLGRHDVAEYAYSTLLALPGLSDAEQGRYREQLAASVYRQAETLRDEQGDTLAAAAMFMRVGQVYPQASIRKNAEFDAATLYIAEADHTSAIKVLEDFRRRYPDDVLTETVPDKLAVAYEATGNFAAAALELERIADASEESDPELSRQALWQAAAMQDQAIEATGSREHTEGAIRLYRKYVWAWPEPVAVRAEGQYRLASLYTAQQDNERRDFWLQKLVETLADAGDDASDRVAWLGAWAGFTLAEEKFQAFSSIRLTQPLRRSLTQKTDAMREALQRYENVAAIGVAEYATAAQFQIGEMYRVLASDIMDSERPRGLDELELEMYELLLEEQALPYEDQAIDLYMANTDMVADDIYDDWVKRSFSALGELLPGRYAKYEQVEPYVDIIY